MANKVELIKTCCAETYDSDRECSDVISNFQTEEAPRLLDAFDCKVTIEQFEGYAVYKAICKGALKKQKAPDAEPKAEPKPAAK